MGRGCAQQGLGALLGLRGAAVQQRLAVLLRVVEVPALHVVLRCHTHHPASSEAVAQSSCARRGGAPRKRRASLPASHSATSGDCTPHTTPTQRPPLRRGAGKGGGIAPGPPAFPAAVGTSPRPCPAHGLPCRAWPAKPTASCRPRRPAPRARSTFPHQHRTHSHLPSRKQRGGEGGRGHFFASSLRLRKW